MTSARRVHHEVCSLLLSALESLRSTLSELAELVPPTGVLDKAKLEYDVIEAGRRLDKLSEAAKVRLSAKCVRASVRMSCG